MTSPAPLIAFGGSVGFTAVMATIGMGRGRQWVQIDSLVWADTWLNTFLFRLPCIATTLTPAAIAVVVALRDAPAPSRERRNWQIATTALAVSVVITLVYHLPTNIRIWTGDLTADEMPTQLHRWLLLHAVRTLAGLVAVVASFRAISASRSDVTDPAAATLTS
jgi:hypothetical protein